MLFNDIVELVSEKIEINRLSLKNYITTDNMQPNLSGIIEADKLPTGTKCNSFQKGDVLFSNIRTYFKKVWFAEFSGGCSADVLVMRSKDTNILLNEYLYMIICSDEFIQYTVASSKGSKMPRGDKNAIKKFELNIPSIEDQKEKIELYFGLNEKIELNTQTNQTLEQIAQAIFKSWFVDFEGFEIGENGLPEGWETCQIAELFEFIGGSQPPKSEHIYEEQEGYERFIQNRDYSSDNYHTYIPISKRNKHCHKKDILICKYGVETGITRFGIEGAYNVALAKLEPKKANLREFLRHYFQQEKIRDFLEASSMASTRNSLNSNSFTGMQIVIPPDGILDKFENMITEFIDKQLQIKEENLALAKLRDTLLPKLLRGEIEL